MQRGWWLVPALLATPAVLARAQGCLPTPDAAAQSIIGSAPPVTALTTGFRVQDVQADPVMHRVWVRVSRCDATGAPLILVPVHAALLGVLPVVSGSTGETPSSIVPVRIMAVPQILPKPAAIHAGDAVLVTFASSAVQMELEGTAEQSAALGDTVGIALRRRGDEPAHRMRGILRADHHVEVQQ